MDLFCVWISIWRDSTEKLLNGFFFFLKRKKKSWKRRRDRLYDHTASRKVTVTAIWSLILRGANSAMIMRVLSAPPPHPSAPPLQKKNVRWVNTASAPHALRFKTRHGPLVRRRASPPPVESRVIRARASVRGTLNSAVNANPSGGSEKTQRGENGTNEANELFSFRRDGKSVSALLHPLLWKTPVPRASAHHLLAAGWTESELYKGDAPHHVLPCSFTPNLWSSPSHRGD